MSPKGMFDKLVQRCGNDGSRILEYYPEGVRTNAFNQFVMKPKTVDYAQNIVTGKYW